MFHAWKFVRLFFQEICSSGPYSDPNAQAFPIDGNSSPWISRKKQWAVGIQVKIMKFNVFLLVFANSCTVETCTRPNILVTSIYSSSSSTFGHVPQFSRLLLFQSPARPGEIMTQILGALQVLNVRWKKVGHYNMKCLFTHSIHSLNSNSTSNHMNDNHYANGTTSISSNGSQPSSAVKFEIQVGLIRDISIYIYVYQDARPDNNFAFI